MKKYLSILVLFGLLLVPAISKGQVSSTVERRVVPREMPILKKSYQSAVQSTTTPKTQASRTVLKIGMKGSDVQKMQALLFNHGYLSGAIDGVFGPATKKAVMAFQTRSGLNVDGIAGPAFAMFSSLIPAGVSMSVLDDGVIQSLREKYIATVTGSTKSITPITPISPAARLALTNKIVKNTVAKLPKGITFSSALTKALPAVGSVSKVAIPIANPTVRSSKVAQAITKKPKLAPLFSSGTKFSLVTAGGSSLTAGLTANLNTNFSSGTATANRVYVCAEYQGDNTCVAVSKEVADLIAGGYVDARDVIADILGGDATGDCPTCFLDGDSIVVTGGNGCGGGGPGTGDFITPPSTPVPGTPQCVPKSKLNEKLSILATADNVFNFYVATKDANGVESLESVLRDMNWEEGQDTNGDGILDLGWASAEGIIGLLKPNASAYYMATYDDDFVTAGALFKVLLGTTEYTSGISPDWEVMTSTVDVEGPVHPNDFSVPVLLEQIKNGAWKVSESIGPNGMSPWGFISMNGTPNLDDAKWVYENSAYNTNRFLVYRLKVCGEGEDPSGPSVTGSCMDFRVTADNIATLGTGNYYVTFSESVTVAGGIPKLEIQKNPNAPKVTALFAGYKDADHKILKFTAQINAGPNANIDSPYYEGTGNIILPTGVTIKNSAGANATLSPMTFNFASCPGSSTLSGDICINFASGYLTYKASFPGPVTVDDNGNKNNIKLVINPPGTGPNLVANYSTISADNKSIYFIAQPTSGALTDHVGPAWLSLAGGATIKDASNQPVDTNLPELTTSKTCPGEGWNGTYEGLIYVTSVVKGPPETLANGKQKLTITVNFANSQSGDPKAYTTGTPGLQLVSSTGVTDVTVPLVSGAGTQTLVFELVKNSAFNLTTFSELQLVGGMIHTLLQDANGNDVYGPANLSALNN